MKLPRGIDSVMDYSASQMTFASVRATLCHIRNELHHIMLTTLPVDRVARNKRHISILGNLIGSRRQCDTTWPLDIIAIFMHVACSFSLPLLLSS
jgi:hypothetical protein